MIGGREAQEVCVEIAAQVRGDAFTKPRDKVEPEGAEDARPNSGGKDPEESLVDQPEQRARIRSGSLSGICGAAQKHRDGEADGGGADQEDQRDADSDPVAADIGPEQRQRLQAAPLRTAHRFPAFGQGCAAIIRNLVARIGHTAALLPFRARFSRRIPVGASCGA